MFRIHNIFTVLSGAEKEKGERIIKESKFFNRRDDDHWLRRLRECRRKPEISWS